MAIVASITLFAACDNGSDPVEIEREAALAISGGDAQSGYAGSALGEMLSVRIKDGDQQPVAGAQVQWQAAGGGSIDPATSATDASGVASARWTLGSATGPQTVQVTSGNLPAVTFRATVLAPVAASLDLSGDAQSGNTGTKLSQPLTITVLDASGRPMAAIPVEWSVVAGGGSVSMRDAVSAADGTASVEWMLGSAVGPQRAQAKVAGVTPALFAASAAALVGADASPDTIQTASEEVTMVFPAGALEAPVAITVEPVTASGVAGWMGVSPRLSAGSADSRIVSSTHLRIKPAGLMLKKTAVLTLRIEPSKLPEDVSVALHMLVGSKWVELGGQSAVNNKFKAEIKTLGELALLKRAAVASVRVTPASASFSALGTSATLTAVVEDQAGQPLAARQISWSSSDAAVASVDSAGRVTAHGNGTAVIVADADGAKGQRYGHCFAASFAGED